MEIISCVIFIWLVCILYSGGCVSCVVACVSCGGVCWSGWLGWWTRVSYVFVCVFHILFLLCVCVSCSGVCVGWAGWVGGQMLHYCVCFICCVCVLCDGGRVCWVGGQVFHRLGRLGWWTRVCFICCFRCVCLCFVWCCVLVGPAGLVDKWKEVVGRPLNTTGNDGSGGDQINDWTKALHPSDPPPTPTPTHFWGDFGTFSFVTYCDIKDVNLWLNWFYFLSFHCLSLTLNNLCSTFYQCVEDYTDFNDDNNMTMTIMMTMIMLTMMMTIMILCE